MSNLTVVINTFRRPEQLVARALSAVLAQQPLPFRLILIDQNQDPLTVPEVIAKSPIFEIQRTQETSVSQARNSLKIPQDTDWLVFCDDDGYWDSGFSELLSQLIDRGEFDVIAGSVIREDTMEFYSMRQKWGGDLNLFRNQKLLMGSNFAVRRELFEKIDQFDGRFGVGARWGSSEETDFAWKCYFSGAKMLYTPKLRVIHVKPFNESLRTGFIKSYRYAFGKGALVAKWLLEEKQPKALHEFAEMLIIPPLQILRGALTLKPALAVNNFGVLVGRCWGFSRFLQSRFTRSISQRS